MWDLRLFAGKQVKLKLTKFAAEINKTSEQLGGPSIH